MKIISLFALAFVGAAGLAAPALAATPVTPTSVPYCSSGNNDTEFQQSKQQLSDQLQLSTKVGSTIGEWNGCLKVMTTDAQGHSVVAFYDPDTLSLIRTLNG